MAGKTLYYDIKYLCNQSIKLNAGCLLDDEGAQARALGKASGYMQIFMQVSFGPYTLVFMLCKEFSRSVLSFYGG